MASHNSGENPTCSEASDVEEVQEESSDAQEEEEDEEAVYFEEEDSDSEPEFDCGPKWDFDCKIIERPPQSKYTGYHLMPSCSRDPGDQSPAKKIKVVPEIRPLLRQQEFVQQIKRHWTDSLAIKTEDFELVTQPFKVSIVDDFIDNAQILNDIRQEFNEVDWNTRNMDLYEFFQSKDLKHLTDLTTIKSTYEYLRTDVMKWIANLTSYDLVDISATCSLYNETDYLLVHDDQRGDRMVAFVLYLSDCQEGGALQLLSRDRNGQPREIVRDIDPRNNRLVFFPVTSDSYHQVAEVLSGSRLSINGWFHTVKPPIFTPPEYVATDRIILEQKITPWIDFDVDLSSWLSPDYLGCSVAKQIQKYFEQHSEICLRKFLRRECLEEIKNILDSGLIKWLRVGPPNRYRYETMSAEDETPPLLGRFLKLFRSEKMFALLEKLTGLDLHRNKESGVKFEVQRWTPGCYSLLGDYDWTRKELDLLIHFGCEDNCDVIGARTQYVTLEDDVQDALITIDPEENNLNLIYRDTARFTKYFSQKSRCKCFYTLICSYSE